METSALLCSSNDRYKEKNENFEFFGLCIQVDHKKFVVKAIPQEMNSDEKDATIQEVDILKKLKHPNIVRWVNIFFDHLNVFSYEENWTENGKIMILMEYCSDGDLHQHIQRHKLGYCWIFTMFYL